VFGGREVGGHCGLGFARRFWQGECCGLKQLVDHRRLRSSLREPVTLAQGQDLQCTDAADQAFKLHPKARLNPGALWGVEQHVHRPVKQATRGGQMSEGQFRLPSRKQLLGRLDQGTDGVNQGSGRRRHRRNRHLGGRRHRQWDDWQRRGRAGSTGHHKACARQRNKPGEEPGQSHVRRW